MRILDASILREILPEIPADADKYARGHLVLVAGSCGMAGAAFMAGKAALRTGAGYLTMVVPRDIYPVLAGLLPEAVFLVYDPEDRENTRILLQKAFLRASAVAAGCGLGELRETVMPIVLENCEKPLLLDADALNFLAAHQDLRPVSRDPVLTPHAGEMGRMLGWVREAVSSDREGALQNALARYGGTILLKGPETLIGGAGEMSVMRLGGPELARAGSGDVLTGIAAGLMAQGVPGRKAAEAGAVLHALAGKEAKARVGLRSVLPTDLIGILPEVLKGCGA